jgi:hypothetical protein
VRLRLIHFAGLWVMAWRDRLERATIWLNTAYSREVGR